MSAKIILVFCAQALFVQSALSQCLGRAAYAPGLAGPYGLDAAYGLTGPYGIDAAYGLAGPYGLASPYGLAGSCGYAAPAIDYTPTSGGGLPVSSASAIAPVGISVASENIYEGILAAAGELPFVGTVAVEGILPTAGAGAVNHACGNGINAMVSDGAAYGPGYAGGLYGPAAAIAPGYAAGIAPAAALGYGWAGRGCGCAL